MKVLQIIGNLEIGGAQEVVRTLAEYLEECGQTLLVCTYKDGPVRKEIENLGIQVIVLPGRRYSILTFPLFAAEFFRMRRDLVNLVKAYHIEVIQTHLLRSMDYLVLSLRLGANSPLVFWTVHNSNFELYAEQLPKFRWLLGPKRAAHRFLFRLAARRVNGIVAVSEDVGKSVLEYAGPKNKKVSVISNGVDARRFARPVDKAKVRRELGFSQSDRLIAVVGTLKEQKGHKVLIDAAPPVVSRFPDVQFLIIGDGDLKEELQLQSKASGLEKNIHFLGSRSDVPDLLAASDLFVLPSLWEGLPMALIEAMASGLPIVSTTVSGSKQVMIQKETGLLVPPGDAFQLSEAMLRLLSDPQEAWAMGEAARRRIEASFSAKRQAVEHANLYHQEWKKSRSFSG